MNNFERVAFTVEDFSREIGVLPATVEKWLDDGRLKGRKFGSMWLITVSELEKITHPESEK